MLNLVAAVAQKEILHLVRDRRTLVLVIVLPIALTFIFGYAFQTGSLDHVKTILVDEDGSTLSLKLGKAMRENKTFDLVASGSKSQALSKLDRGEAMAVVVLPKGLLTKSRGGGGVVDAYLSGVDTVSAPSVKGALLGILLENGLKLAGLKFHALGLSRKKAEGILRPVELRSQIRFNEDLSFLIYVMPGIIGLILQLLTVILTAGAITREKERGTFFQLTATPVSRFAVVVGKLVPYLLVSAVDVAAILLVARFWFLVSFGSAIPKVLLLSALFIGSSLATGLLISALCKNQTQAMQIAVFYCMPAVMLSGAYSPIEILPPSVRVISYTFPLTYFCRAFRKVYLMQGSLGAVSLDILVLVGFTVVALLVGGLLLRKQEA